MNPLFIAGAQATKHAVLRTLSVICVLLVCAGLYYAVYKTFIKPKANESYTQKAETINNTEHNYYPNKRVFSLGLSMWGWDVGIMKYDYGKKEEKKNN